MTAKEIFSGKNVDVYAANQQVGESALQNDAHHVTVHDREAAQKESKGGVTIEPYITLVEAADCIADVCMLNNEAVKILVAMYPSAPRYVLVRLRFHRAWLLGALGLMRRLLARLVRIRGIVTIKNVDNEKSRWLVLEQTGRSAPKIPVLPAAFGVQAFIDWLNKEKIEYAVLRFYEQLPKLHRAAGDLDILVDDKDKQKVTTFLESLEHLRTNVSEDIRIGLHSVSGNSGNVPYYPPPLARQILSQSVEGPAGARIPSPEDALHSFVYHALYHAKKGYSSGIPSSLKKYTDKHPENDYASRIKEMAAKLQAPVGNTMEEMDEYLATVGWRPKLDTLAKIAETNAWVQDRFFAKVSSQDFASGLSVFMVRDWVIAEGLKEKVISIIEQEGFSILKAKLLKGEIKKAATEELRGGTWGTNENGEEEGMHPALAVVALDTQCVRMPKAYADGFERFRIRKLKELLRDELDTNGRSSIHSTDNTRESWEYIAICFPESVGELRDEIQKESQGFSLRALAHALSPKYLKHAIKQSLRDFMIRRFLS